MTYVWRTCKVCGNSFRCRESNTKRIWCSDQCRKILNMKTCPLCGKKFLQNRNKKYCNGPHWKTCPQCGKAFDCTKNPQQTYCSAKCRGVYEAEHGIRKQINKKALQTVKQRYGADCVAHIPGTQDKKKQTCLKRYGVEHVWLDADIQAKRKTTLFEKYGASGPMGDRLVQQKAKQTCLKRYGVEHPAQNVEIKNKTREHFQQKYCVNAAMQVPEFKEKFNSCFIDKYGCMFGSVPYQRQKAENTMLAKYGVKYGTITPQNRYNLISHNNRLFLQFLNENNVKAELEFALPEKSYDVKVGNTLIEIDPTYTHNALAKLNSRCKAVDKQYHASKSKYAMENGYRCIHVWDWDDWYKILDLLPANKTVIGARQCAVHHVSKYDAHAFLNKYHLQCSCNGQLYRYGMYYNDELVAVMTFGKPRYNNNFEYELLRLCFKSGIQVTGGSERLFKHFVSEVNPKSIISYCDNSKFTGNVYRNLNMKLNNTGKPTKHWYSSKPSEKMQHVTDNFLRQRGFDQIFGTQYGKGTSNEQLMLERGYLPIYDCGQSRYTWCR